MEAQSLTEQLSQNGLQRMKIRLQKVNITAASGAAGVVTSDYEPDSGYDEIIGVALAEITDGGIANAYYEVGLRDDGGAIWMNSVHKIVLEFDSNVAQDKKFQEVTIPIRQGQILKIDTNRPAAPVTNIEYQLIFRLAKRVARVRNG